MAARFAARWGFSYDCDRALVEVIGGASPGSTRSLDVPQGIPGRTTNRSRTAC